MAFEINNRRNMMTPGDVARLEAARAVIESAPREPHALDFVLEGDRFVVAKGFADDVAAAADRHLIARQQTILEKLRDLAEDIGHRLENQGGWKRLPRQLKRLLEALNITAEQLPDRVGRIYDLSTSLASFVDYDNDLTADRLATDEQLPPDIRRGLRDAVATLAVWVRSFPSARATDDEAGAFLNRPERFETVRENLPATRKLIETARDVGALSEDDAADALLPFETAESAPRGGVQAEKAGYRADATGRSFLKAVAGAVFAIQLGALGSALEKQAPIYERIAAFALRIPDETARIARTMPSDLRVAVEEGLRRAKDIADGGMLPVPVSGPLPTPPAAPRRDPPPDFDIGEVKRLILAGKAPPATWVPYIHELDFRGTDLAELSPLAGLIELGTLNVDLTKLTSITPLQHLTNLHFISLNGTNVSDLSPLSKLPFLVTIACDSIPWSDIGQLGGMRNLRTLICHYTKISSLDRLEKASLLETLNIAGTNVSDLLPLAACSSLRNLEASNTKITSLHPLASLTNLEILTVTRTPIVTLDALEHHSALTTLDVSGTRITTVTKLRGLTQLGALSLDDTEVDNLDGLEGLTSLEWLSLAGTKVRSLKLLENLPRLQSLNITRTSIQDLSPLAAISTLKHLSLSKSANIDMSPLLHRADLHVDQQP